MAAKAKNAFGEFARFLKGLLGSMSIVAALLPPIIGLLSPDLVPPWPDSISALTGGVAACLAVGFFFGLRHHKKATKRRLGGVLMFVAVVGLVVWLASMSMLIVERTDEFRVVRGFSLYPEVEAKVREGVVSRQPSKLLDAYGWRSAEQIWSNVPLARLLTCLAFVFVFASISCSLCAYALQEFR